MFSTNSPKMPIGATFNAEIAPSRFGSALSLKVDPESVQLDSDSEQPSLSEQLKQVNLSFGQVASRQGGSLGKSSSRHLASKVLHEAIKEKYAATGERKIKVGEWTGFINSFTQECFVRDENRQVIFNSNLATNQIHQGLSEAGRIKFERQIMDSLAQKTMTSVNREESEL